MRNDFLKKVARITESADAIADTEPTEGKITDTSKISEPGVPNLLACQLLAGGTIEAMEARGQQELVGQATRLPAEGIAEQPELWEQIGVQVGEVDPNDDLFVRVVLPEGWKLRPTEHSMWSDLVDATECVRAHIFYKAAFYDRRAHIRLQPRFDLEGEYSPDFEISAPREGRQWRIKVKDYKMGTFIFFSSYASIDDCKSMDTYREEASAWLLENYPNHRDPAAYWED